MNKLQEVRVFLENTIKEKGLSLNALSLQLGKNSTYLFHFVKRNSPKRLDENTRRKLATILNVDNKKDIYMLVDSISNNRFTSLRDYVCPYNSGIDVLAAPKDPRDVSRIESKYISKILDIHKEFIYLFNEENKIKVIEVLSASQLSSDEKEKLHNSLIKCYAGYEVIIHNKIDSKIIGGYHILVNGVSIDLSVKRKLSDLQKHILN